MGWIGIISRGDFLCQPLVTMCGSDVNKLHRVGSIWQSSCSERQEFSEDYNSLCCRTILLCHRSLSTLDPQSCGDIQRLSWISAWWHTTLPSPPNFQRGASVWYLHCHQLVIWVSSTISSPSTSHSLQALPTATLRPFLRLFFLFVWLTSSHIFQHTWGGPEYGLRACLV